MHTGIVFSGGSADEPYDSVNRGRTVCVLPLVPLVPLSSSGSLCATQHWSTYSRACTLSRALATPSRLVQNGSTNVLDSSPTFSSYAMIFIFGLMAATAAAAHRDLALPTSDGRKRNWRLRFDFSIVSMSVTCTAPPPDASHPTPIRARHLSSSHPMAPAPTTK